MAPSAPSKVATPGGSLHPLPGDEKLLVTGERNNLFDKTYDTNVEGSIVYGARVISALPARINSE